MASNETVLVLDTGVDQVRGNTNPNRMLGRKPTFLIIRVSIYTRMRGVQ